MDWASSLLGSTMMSPVAGAAIMGLGSYLGTSQNNAAQAANINNQWLANSGLMNQQTTQNWQTMDKALGQNWSTMDKQFDLNSQLMDKQASINSGAAQWAFDRSQQQLQEVQGYNTSMANTAYQRMSADMRAAGLNPILGVSSGGAATPGLSANSVAAPTVGGSSVSGLGVGTPGTSGSSVNTPQTQSALANAISSAAQGAKLFAGIKQAQAEADNSSQTTELLQKQTDKAAADAKGSEIDASNRQKYWDAQIASTLAQGGQSAAQAALAQQQKDNNASGPQIRGTVYIPGFASGEVSGPAGPVSKIFTGGLSGAAGWLSPISPQPSTTNQAPVLSQFPAPHQNTVFGVPFGRQQ